MPSKCKNATCHYFAGSNGYCKNHDGNAKPSRAPPPATVTKALDDADAAAKRAATVKDKAARAAHRAKPKSSEYCNLCGSGARATGKSTFAKGWFCPTCRDTLRKDHAVSAKPKAAAPAKPKAAPAYSPAKPSAEQIRAELADLTKIAKAAATLRLSGNIAAAQSKDRAVDMMVRGLEAIGQGDRAMLAEEKGRQAARARAPVVKPKAPKGPVDRDPAQTAMDNANYKLFQKYGLKGPYIEWNPSGYYWRDQKQIAQNRHGTLAAAVAEAKSVFG